MLAKEDASEPSGQTPGVPASKDDIYENRPMAKKVIRIITVMAYLVSVSFVAIVLSAYYIFLWQPPIGGSLSLRDPHAEYLMESPPVQQNDNKSIIEIIEKINLFRKNIVHQRGFNRTRASTMGFLNDKSKNVANLTKMMGLIRSAGKWVNSDTSTGVYESIGGKFNGTFATTKSDLNGVSEPSTASPSTVQGEEYFDVRNFTHSKARDEQNLVGTSGGVVGYADGVVNDTSRQDHSDDYGRFTEMSTSTRDDYNVSDESTSSEGIQETTTVKPNAPVYIDENQPIERPTELEASLDPLATINPTSSDYKEDISEENIEEPLDIEFDSANLPRR